MVGSIHDLSNEIKPEIDKLNALKNKPKQIQAQLHEKGLLVKAQINKLN